MHCYRDGLELDWALTGQAGLKSLVASLIGVAVQCNAAAAHLHAPALAFRKWPIRVVAVAHSCMATWWDGVHGGAGPRDIEWHAAATKQGLLAVDAVVAPSAAFAATLRRVYGLVRPVHVVHNGLPAPALHDANRDANREPFVLTAGRLWDPAKNIGMLDAAAAAFQVPLRAAGPLGQPRGAAISLANTDFLGTLSAVALGQAMARAAIFVSPSLYEPFGLAVLEAAQRGTPLILSDIPVFRELWSGAALFVPPAEPASWAAAVNALMDDAGRRRHLGNAAASRSRLHTQEAMVRATTGIHRSLADRALRAA